MAIYQYRAKDSSGRIVEGKVEAETDGIAENILADRDLSVLSLSEQKIGFDTERITDLLTRVKMRDIVIFSRQLSVMISAHVPLVQALKGIVLQTENPKLRKLLAQVADDVEGGSRLSDALAKNPKVFSGFFVNIIKSGESSGKLDEVLSYLADQQEKDYDLFSKIKGAMYYPIFIILGIVVVGIIMMVKVIPNLTSMITESGADLPLSTKILIATSGFMESYWWLVVILLLACVLGTYQILKTKPGKAFFDRALLKLPIFGILFQQIYIVRFTRSLNTLLIGGVDLVDGLKITSGIVQNQVYKDLILKAVVEVQDGNPVSKVFSESNDMPAMVAQMMATGEQTGSLSMILEKLSDFYAREVDNMVRNMMSLLEPIIMVVLGIAVAIMVAAVILPMYQLSSSY